MFMRRKKEEGPHVRDFECVIEEVIRLLPNGETRLGISSFPLSSVCLNEFHSPDISERLYSDYGFPAKNEQIVKEFYGEIATIETLIQEAKIPIRFANWQESYDIESLKNKYETMNRRSYAIQIWNWYGISWRFRDGNVYVVYAPDDIEGSPIIHSYPVHLFLRIVADNLQRQRQQSEEALRSLDKWKVIGIIALASIGCLIWGMIKGLLAN